VRSQSQWKKQLLFNTEQSEPNGLSPIPIWADSEVHLLDELGEITDKLDQFGEEKFFIEINEGLIGILEVWLNIRIYFDFFIILKDNETQTGFKVASVKLLF
jgi:hypothetical protein